MRFTAKIGFTLIELMITIVIIGILATVAVPAYKKYIENAKFADGYFMIGEMRTLELAYYGSYDRFFYGGTNVDGSMLTKLANGQKVVMSDHGFVLQSLYIDTVTGNLLTDDHIITFPLASQPTNFGLAVTYGKEDAFQNIFGTGQPLFIGINLAGAGTSCTPNTTVGQTLVTDYGIDPHAPNWFTVTLVGNFPGRDEHCVMLIQAAQSNSAGVAIVNPMLTIK